MQRATMRSILSTLLVPMRVFGDSAMLVLATLFWVGVLLAAFLLFGVVFILVGSAVLALWAQHTLKRWRR